MSRANNGGPAFPVGSGDMRDPTGMTLRDYAAIKAMQGYLTHDVVANQSNELIATWAYQMADAMLHARGAA